MFLAFFIASKMLLLRIKIPFFVARLRTIAMTVGTASPSAHGQDETKIPIPLSTTQQILHPGTYTILKKIKKLQTAMTKILRKITPFTK